MKEFLKEQISKIEKELKQLYIDRARSSIETEGSYDILIDRKKRELDKLINDLDGKKNNTIPSNDLDFRTEIKNLIAKGKTGAAIKKLMDNSEDDQLILLSARYNRIQTQNNSGTISPGNFSIELNKITNSLLNIVNGL